MGACVVELAEQGIPSWAHLFDFREQGAVMAPSF